MKPKYLQNEISIYVSKLLDIQNRMEKEKVPRQYVEIYGSAISELGAFQRKFQGWLDREKGEAK